MLPDGPLLAAFLIASAVVVTTPGPDMLYVVSRSIGQGRRAGMVAALGTGSGLVGHGAAAALGLSGLFLHAPAAYQALRWAASPICSIWPGERSPTTRRRPCTWRAAQRVRAIFGWSTGRRC